MLGETDKVVPVPTCVPPQLPLYQTQFGDEFSVPPLTCKVVDCPALIVVRLAVALVGVTGAVQTVVPQVAFVALYRISPLLFFALA